MIRHLPSSTLSPYTTLFRSIDILNEADVPCAPIVDRPNVRFEPQIVANELMVEVNHPVVGRTHIAGTTVRLSDMPPVRSEEHTSELQSPMYLVCRLLLEKKK